MSNDAELLLELDSEVPAVARDASVKWVGRDREARVLCTPNTIIGVDKPPVLHSARHPVIDPSVTSGL